MKTKTAWRAPFNPFDFGQEPEEQFIGFLILVGGVVAGFMFVTEMVIPWIKHLLG